MQITDNLVSKFIGAKEHLLTEMDTTISLNNRTWYNFLNSKVHIIQSGGLRKMTKLKTYKRRGGNVDEDPIFQGLKKKHKCKLCEQEFFVDELPGAISYKAVLDLRAR